MGRKRIKTAIGLLFQKRKAPVSAEPGRYARNSAGNWMAKLDDSRSLRTLSVPGTHDSGALHAFAGLSGKCQTLKIPQQLDIGVRYLDLRLRLVADELRIYHSFVDQKAKFDDVLAELVLYLRQNPTEFLILSLKEEGPPLRSARQFRETLESKLRQYPQVVCPSNRLPKTVGSARGKIHIIARYENSTMGLDCAAGWENNTSFRFNGLFVQDHYRLGTVEEKLPDITVAFHAAASGTYDMVLNYASCYIAPGFPPAYAGKTARIINPWLQQQLAETDGPAGVVVCDFIAAQLSMAVIGRNFP